MPNGPTLPIKPRMCAVSSLGGSTASPEYAGGGSGTEDSVVRSYYFNSSLRKQQVSSWKITVTFLMRPFSFSQSLLLQISVFNGIFWRWKQSRWINLQSVRMISFYLSQVMFASLAPTPWSRVWQLRAICRNCTSLREKMGKKSRESTLCIYLESVQLRNESHPKYRQLCSSPVI